VKASPAISVQRRLRQDAIAFARLRREACSLDELERAWHVHAGASGPIYALPLWDPGRSVILEAGTTAEIVTPMRAAEAAVVRSAAPSRIADGSVPGPGHWS
jgi:hypothetical protein